jgi:hypothetical protein
MTAQIAPAAGTPATLVYVTDSSAWVVTRVSPKGKSLWARRVEVGPVRWEDDSEAFRKSEVPPVTLQDGLLDQPYGDEVRFTLRKSGRWIQSGAGGETRYSSRLVLGHSVRRVDYKV